MTLPRGAGIEARTWILPPPHLVAGITGTIRSCDEVRVTVAVDVPERSSRLRLEGFILNQVSIPAVRGAPVPDRRRHGRSLRDHEIVHTVFVDIEDGRRCL